MFTHWCHAGLLLSLLLSEYRNSSTLFSVSNIPFLWRWVVGCSDLVIKDTIWQHFPYHPDLTFRTEHSVVTCSQHIVHLWVSALSIIHCDRKLLWSRPRAALMYGHRHEYSGGSLKPCPFRKTIVVSSAQGSMTCPVLGLRPARTYISPNWKI